MLVLVVLGVVLGVASVGGACDRLVGSSGGSTVGVGRPCCFRGRQRSRLTGLLIKSSIL